MKHMGIDAKERLVKSIQEKLDGNPAILVGSGGSIPYGLPSMYDLALKIISSLNSVYMTDPGWVEFKNKLSINRDFELAMGDSTISGELHNDIVKVIWKTISRCDREALRKFIKTNTQPDITMIIQKFIQRAGSTNIITTNYDRIIEYAISRAKGNIINGFCGSIYGNYNCPQYSNRIRDVNLYKVHGSVDWFRDEISQASFSTSIFTSSYCNNCSPLIVTPGNGKYRETHNDPFRTVMSESDRALRKSTSYLCIGYGFNDEHIQPIIIEENIANKKAIVIITKTITDKILRLFLEDYQCNCLVISEESPNKTAVHYSRSDVDYIVGNYWNTREFYKLWFE